MSIEAYYKDGYVTEYEGHTPAVLKQMPAESVHMMLTSPPYFGLRSYGTEPQIWLCGCDVNHSEGCKHWWGDEIRTQKHGAQGNKSTLVGRIPVDGEDRTTELKQGQFCQKCNAWKGDLGNEPTIDLYIEHLIQIFKEVKRVLRRDGTLWIVISDSYWGGKGQSGHGDPEFQQERFDKGISINVSAAHVAGKGRTRPQDGKHDILKSKDLCGIPWRLAFALQADGWYLRKDIIWAKPSCMPESISGWRWEKCSVKIKPQGVDMRMKHRAEGRRNPVESTNPDLVAQWVDCPGCPKCEPNDGYVLRKGSWRPTSSHEYVFMLAKSERYFCDGEVVREACSETSHGGPNIVPGWKNTNLGQGEGNLGKWTEKDKAKGRNLRSVLTIGDNLNEFLKYCQETFGWDVEKAVDAFIGGQDERKDVWTINPESTTEKHFAAFPSKLCEIAIKAGTSERGCCPECGAPWVRVVERKYPEMRNVKSRTPPGQNQQGLLSKKRFDEPIESKTIGWKPSCKHREVKFSFNTI